MSSGTNEAEDFWEEGFWLEYRVEERVLSRKARPRTTKRSRRVRTIGSWAVHNRHIQCLISDTSMPLMLATMLLE